MENTHSPTESHRMLLCEHLKSLPSCRRLCDVTLATSSEHPHLESDIHCHQVVLCAVSAFFRDIITKNNNNFTDKTDRLLVINVAPVKYMLLKEVVSFMYTGQCTITDATATDLLALALQWKLENLSLNCLNHIKYLLTVDNVTEYYESLTTRQCNELAQFTTVFIRGHFTELCQSRHLNSLSLENFCTILESDEINVDSEDVVFDSVVKWVEFNKHISDVTKLLALIRYQGLSRDFLCDVVLDHRLMQDPPQALYVRAAMKGFLKQSKESSPVTDGHKRYWHGFDAAGTRQTNKLIYPTRLASIMGEQICLLDAKKWNPVMKTPLWMDKWGGIATTYSQGLIIPRTNDTFVGWQLYLLDISEKWQIRLPDLPVATNSAGIIYSDQHIYILGGAVPEGFGFVKTNKVFRLCIDGATNPWEELTSLSEPLTQPIVISDAARIYVIGGVDADKKPARMMHVYSKKDNAWKVLQGAPEECDCVKSGAIIYNDDVTIFTTSACMVYQSASDTWRIKEYDTLGDDVKPVVHNGVIIGCVRKEDKYSLQRYDMKTNVWTTEDVDMSNCCATRYMHTL